MDLWSHFSQGAVVVTLDSHIGEMCLPDFGIVEFVGGSRARVTP